MDGIRITSGFRAAGRIRTSAWGGTAAGHVDVGPRDTTEGRVVSAHDRGRGRRSRRPSTHPALPRRTRRSLPPARAESSGGGPRPRRRQTNLDRDGSGGPRFERPGTVGWARAGPRLGYPGRRPAGGRTWTRRQTGGPASTAPEDLKQRGEAGALVARSDSGTTAEFTVERTSRTCPEALRFFATIVRVATGAADRYARGKYDRFRPGHYSARNILNRLP